MSERSMWQEENERYLSASLAWLRLRLQKLADENHQSQGELTPLRRAHHFWKQYAGATANREGWEAELQRAVQAREAAANIAPPPALEILSQQFGLSPFERDIVLLCAAMELDTRIAALCAQAQDAPQRPYPTFALALALFDEPTWAALAPNGPLRYWRLLEVKPSHLQPVTSSPLQADELLVNYIKGLYHLDQRLTSMLTPSQSVDLILGLPAAQSAVVADIVRHLGQAESWHRASLFQLVGPDRGAKRYIAEYASAALGLHLYHLSAELLPVTTTELDAFVRLLQRESSLLPMALYLDVNEVPAAPDGREASVSRFLDRHEGIVFLDTHESRFHGHRVSLAFDIDKPTPAEQREIWSALVGHVAPDIETMLAGQFNLNLPTIQRVAETLLDELPLAEADKDDSIRNRLWDACRQQTRPRLDTLAQRLETKANWHDLILPDLQTETLGQITAQVQQRSQVYDAWGFRSKMNRGFGISVLFAGDSGTGKTMAAEVIANALRLDLYRIDLSAVVNKYIGETEKNLRRVFDAAEDGGMVLFFDEADALFGKRSEVKDSHDRYANIEINYLLQRIEAYRGLAILATNMKSALDHAFLRRLRFIVEFPFPGIPERRRIWQRVFPADTPGTASLDFDWLARFNLTVGSIHNIALNAAFLAAQAGTPVTMPLVLEAAKIELRKLELPINNADFNWRATQG